MRLRQEVDPKLFDNLRMAHLDNYITVSVKKKSLLNQEKIQVSTVQPGDRSNSLLSLKNIYNQNQTYK